MWLIVVMLCLYETFLDFWNLVPTKRKLRHVHVEDVEVSRPALRLRPGRAIEHHRTLSQGQRHTVTTEVSMNIQLDII